MCVCVCVCVCVCTFVHVHVCATALVCILCLRVHYACSLIQCMYAHTGEHVSLFDNTIANTDGPPRHLEQR